MIQARRHNKMGFIHTSRSALLLAAALALGIGAAQPAWAQESGSRMTGLALKSDQPIQIESDKLEINEKDKRAVFTGNVKVTQDDMLLQAGLMTVYYKTSGDSVASGASDIDRINVSNKVLLRSGTQTATADTGAFDMGAQTMVLSGDKVVLTDGDNIFIGCKLTVQMQSGEAQLDACGGRVMIQLDPKSRPKK
ncbi:lipopolysaccharide export system protein LptA [Hoeflea marina]|uniref:Lipopolysaccharide export system protein LptA n=2 Tax=Hoeflea marina TaxID=274592 RepID=A0A317PM02_9HYPH|nr:lipopolysaccharide export system protein LptA [Hoeflea marina]